MNRKLETERYFVTDIVAGGRILFENDSLTLSDEKVLTPVERLELDEAKRNPGETLSSLTRPTNHVEIRMSSRIVRVAEFPQFTRKSKPLVKR
jgi:hypothetical protein